MKSYILKTRTTLSAPTIKFIDFLVELIPGLYILLPYNNLLNFPSLRMPEEASVFHHQPLQISKSVKKLLRDSGVYISPDALRS